MLAWAEILWRVKDARLCPHPICAGRRWWVRHLKPKTATLDSRPGQIKPFLYLKMSSSDHPNTITAGCPTASGNSDTLYYNYVSQARSLQHFRPRQLQDGSWLQHEPSFFSVWVRISTHRVGIVGIGPWPSSPGAPGVERPQESSATFSKLEPDGSVLIHLTATRTCSLLAYQDPLCCVEASCLHQSSGKRKANIITCFSSWKPNLFQQRRKLIYVIKTNKYFKFGF